MVLSFFIFYDNILNMDLIYIDESKDAKHVCFSALMIPAEQWNDAFDHLRGMRSAMKASDGVFVRKELHTTDWLGGRGRVGPDPVPKGARLRLFDYCLSAISLLPGVQVFNAHAGKAKEEALFQHLVQCIDNNAMLRERHAMIISDEGKSYDHLLHKMRASSPVPGPLSEGANEAGMNAAPMRHVIEDIVYRDSAKSLFIQAADFCAYSLLHFENPSPRAKAVGFDTSFRILDRRLMKNAYHKDPKAMGIIRA